MYMMIQKLVNYIDMIHVIELLGKHTLLMMYLRFDIFQIHLEINENQIYYQ